ncbi:hypothetical protein [Phocaeicola faecalis]
MKPNIIHSIVVCLAAFALPFIVACSSQEESLSANDTEAALFLNIATLEQARSGEVTKLPDNEKMHSVRVVVLHENGTVEHNQHYSLEGAQAQKDIIILKVKPKEKKKIFLFANEESVSTVEGVPGGNQTLTEFFNNYTKNTPNFAKAVNDLYFTPDYSDNKSIPMSSMYEIDFTEGKVEKTFYVVRVATKFTVNFMNWRSEEVTVEKFTLASYADKNFLMAHVKDSKRNEDLFKGKSWIEWLKEVSDASSEGDSYEKTEDAGWLKDYELPTHETKEYTHNESIIVGEPTVNIDYPDNNKPGVAKSVPVFYLPESQNLIEAGATKGEQEYTLTVKMEGRDEPFVETLPNLKALFRNTHVIVNITLLNSMEIVVDVIPYSEVTLDPEFGL